jgi:hypothetical protein
MLPLRSQVIHPTPGLVLQRGDSSNCLLLLIVYAYHNYMVPAERQYTFFIFSLSLFLQERRAVCTEDSKVDSDLLSGQVGHFIRAP